MSLFSSSRERRLWLYTLVVMGAILSTLGLARILADELAAWNLGAPLFLFCCLLVLAAVITQGLSTRPSGVEWAVAIGIFACYLLIFLRMAVPTERSHLIEYGVVALLVDEALRERRRNGHRVPWPSLLAIVLTTLLGALDECVQLLLPSRSFDTDDILFNGLAAVMAVTGSGMLRWARAQTQRLLHS